MFKKLNIAWLACLVLLVAVLTGCKAPGKQEVKQESDLSGSLAIFSGMPSAWWGISNPYEGEEAVARVEGHGVPADELVRFASRFGLEPSHGTAPQARDFVDAYVNFTAAIAYARKAGIADRPDYTDSLRLVGAAGLASIYQKWAIDNASVDSQVLADSLPSEFLKMNFVIKAFSNMDTAENAAESVRTLEQFESLRTDVYATARGQDAETGLIFPRSGFFSEFDDAELYSLQEGAIHGPVETGLGPAMVYIKERYELTDEEKNEYLQVLRDNMAAEKVSMDFKLFREGLGLEMDEALFSAAVYREINKRGISDDTVARIGGVDVSYRVFRQMDNKSFDFIKSAFPNHMWPARAKPYLTQIMDQVAIGMMGIEQFAEKGIEPEIPLNLLKTLYEYRNSLLYVTLLKSLKEVAAAELSDEQVAEYYDLNKDALSVPESIEFSYVFAVDKELVILWKELINEGKSFGEILVEAPPGAGHGDPRNPDVGVALKERIKSARITRGDLLHKDIQEELFLLVKGEENVLEGSMGTYLVDIKEKLPAGTPPLDKVSGELKDFMAGQLLYDALNRIIAGTVGQVEYEVFEDTEALGDVSPGNQVPKGHPDLPTRHPATLGEGMMKDSGGANEELPYIPPHNPEDEKPETPNPNLDTG